MSYCPVNGKVRHKSQHAAAKQLRGARHVYRCPVCHDWHVSHDSPDKIAKQIARQKDGR